MLFDPLRHPDVRPQYFALSDELSNSGLLYMQVLPPWARAPALQDNGPRNYTDYPTLA
jgi:hypothetical protein